MKENIAKFQVPTARTRDLRTEERDCTYRDFRLNRNNGYNLPIKCVHAKNCSSFQIKHCYLNHKENLSLLMAMNQLGH